MNNLSEVTSRILTDGMNQGEHPDHRTGNAKSTICKTSKLSEHLRLRLMNKRKGYIKPWSNNIFVGDQSDPTQDQDPEYPPPIKLTPGMVNPIDFNALRMQN